VSVWAQERLPVSRRTLTELCLESTRRPSADFEQVQKCSNTLVLSEFYLPTESDTEVPSYWVEPHTLSCQGFGHELSRTVQRTGSG
jgi:hypothetical protein